MLNYLGQGVFILHHPTLAKDANTFNPFYQMAPRWALWPMVILAAVATVIASQAAISGSFSVAKQAVQLGFLPRLKVLHTSKMEGQIYVPVVNWALCIGVVALTLVFRSATKLGDIYGVAVTGTFILNTVAVPGRRQTALGYIETKARARRGAVPDRRGRVLQLQHRQDRARRLAVARDRARDVDRDDQLAPGPDDRHTEPRRPRGTAGGVPRRARREAAAARASARRRGLPLPRQGAPPRSRCAQTSSTPTRSTRRS